MFRERTFVSRHPQGTEMNDTCANKEAAIEMADCLRHFHFVLSSSFPFSFLIMARTRKKKLHQQKDSWKVNQLILGASHLTCFVSKTPMIPQRTGGTGEAGSASFYTDDDGVSVIRDMEVRKRSV
jgi:hypothetical protein